MKKLLAPLGLLLATACTNVVSTDDSIALHEDALEQNLALTDDIRVEHFSNYKILVLSGPAALDLYNVLDDAGFSASTRNGLNQRQGNYSICVSNGSAAACHVYTDEVHTDIEGFAAVLYGERGGSAASELFGATALAAGERPQDVSNTQSARIRCGKNEHFAGCGFLLPEPTVTEPEGNITVTLDGFEPLGGDYVYEGWLIVDGVPFTGGRFDLDEGNTVVLDLDPDHVRRASMYVITIEPKFGDDPAPSDTHLVAGPFNGDEAVLTVDHGAALGSDFMNASGQFLLATPTSEDPSTATQGIWFLDPSAGPAASLDLPRLPRGWAYEGWIVTEDGPISTGRFTKLDAADDDGAGPAAGPLGAPPFPGQDFIDPALDIAGATVVISIEPEPDNSAGPFALKPLVGGASDMPRVLQDLGNNAGSIGSGLVQRH